MEKIGDRWNRENVTVYGRALISNTLMCPQVLYKGKVNGMSVKMKKEIVEKVKEFVWKKVTRVKWSVAVRKVEEGGIGVKDPICLLDSTRIRMIRDMRMKEAQPWVKWMNRKERKLKERWGVESVFKGRVKKKMIAELKDECVFESAVKVWHELKGITKKEEGEEVMKIRIGEHWRDLKKIKGREIYEQLLQRRHGTSKNEAKNTNHAMTSIARQLTPQQRQFWWRVAHKNYMTNDRAHKWKVDRRGRAPNECNVCRSAIESWDHMEYECDGVKKWMERMKSAYEEYTDMENGEWRIPMSGN